MSDLYAYGHLVIPYLRYGSDLTQRFVRESEVDQSNIGRERRTAVTGRRIEQTWQIGSCFGFESGKIEETLKLAIVADRHAVPNWFKHRSLLGLDGSTATMHRSGGISAGSKVVFIDFGGEVHAHELLTVKAVTGTSVEFEAAPASFTPQRSLIAPLLFGRCTKITIREVNAESRDYSLEFVEGATGGQPPAFFVFDDGIGVVTTATGENWNQFVTAPTQGEDELLAVGIADFGASMTTDVIDGGSAEEGSAAAVTMAGFMESMPLVDVQDTADLGVILSGEMT